MCQVTFAISEEYEATFYCDVISMDCGDVLFGRSWMLMESTGCVTAHTFHHD